MGDHRLFADFSTQELEEEVRRRHLTDRPQPLSSAQISWGHVIDFTEKVMDSMQSGHGVPKDFEFNLFQEVMDNVYGEGTWKHWFNQQLHKK